MDLEARSLQPSVKAALLAKLREYKTDLSNLKSEVKRVTSASVNLTARDDLLESGRADTLAGWREWEQLHDVDSLTFAISLASQYYASYVLQYVTIISFASHPHFIVHYNNCLWMLGQASNDQKGRLLMSTERLNQSSDRIKESRKTMLETEDLGEFILRDLHQQRESLLHAHKTIHGVDDNISKSKKILSAMSRRMSRNKWIVSSLMTALVLAILIILYFKLTH
ncbi:hypothetical protein AAZV13_06G178900 [Glycine max]